MRVELDATDRSLYDGMGAAVAIKVGSARDVLTVPVSALDATGSQYTVNGPGGP